MGCVPRSRRTRTRFGRNPKWLEKLQQLPTRTSMRTALEQLRKLERCANDPVRLHLSSCAWLHRIASQQGRTRYVDPRTGLGVFTATALKTGACCGLHCRHCPHGQGPGGLLTAEEKITMLDW
ncbi:unnamed protein product [Durusdinium trenchii]